MGARARDAAREAAQIEWCQEDPWVRSGRYPEDFFKGWFGHVLEAFEEPDYEGNRLQRAIEARSDERPRPLTDNERRALRALREGVRRDTYAGGLSLWPVYLDAVVAARARTGYTLWRALSIKRAQYSDQSDRRWGGGDDGGGRPVYRTDERSWALAYARGEGSLYMDDMAAAAERFPPCDYLFGGRITQVSDFLADWEDRTHPRYPEEQARMVATAANLRAAAATAYNLARHDPRRLVVSALTPRVKVRPR